MLHPRTSRRNLAECWTRAARLLSIPPALSISQWAERYRYLSPEASSRPGKWSSLPMQVEPMDAALDPEVESLCLMWASQAAGKTEIILNIQGYFIDHDPSPQLVIQPTVEAGETYSKDRLSPMVRDTPRLRGTIRDPRSRDSGNTILHKIFPGGHLTVIGANAPAGLAMRPIRVLLCDEVDRYPSSAGTEGDPILLAKKRTDTYQDAVIVFTSTPTIKDFSRIEAEWKQSDQRYWFVACHACGTFQRLYWAGVKWPEGEPAKAYYQCEKCEAHWNEAERVEAIKKGEWRPTTPFKGKRGYHLNAIYSIFPPKKGFKTRIHQMVAHFLEAKRLGEQAQRVWTNTDLAETWEVKGQSLESGPLMNRIETYGDTLPAGILVLVAGVDVQANRIEIEVIGYGAGDESWGVVCTTIDGSPEMDATWEEFDRFLLREYIHSSGHKLRVACCCIDTGYKSKQVYAFCRARTIRRVFAVKGSSIPNMPLVTRPQKTSVRQVLLFSVGTDTAKEIIYSRLLIDEPGPRFCHFPVGSGYNEEYFDQLTSEKCSTEWEKGKPRRVWIKKRARNEALDRRVYALAALEILNPDWNALKKNLAMPKPAPIAGSNEGPKVQQTPGKAIVQKRQSWVNSWRG